MMRLIFNALSCQCGLLVKLGPGPWTYTRILKNVNPGKRGPLKSWTLTKMDPEKHGINMGLKNMPDFRDLNFIKTTCNVICCLKFTEI